MPVINPLPRWAIHHSNLIEGFDSEIADKALRLAWKRLPRAASKAGNIVPPLNHKAIKEAQALAVIHQNIPDIWVGRYRSDINPRNNDSDTGMVWIGGRAAPRPYKVQQLMDEWLEKYGDYHKEFDPIEAHIEFEKIHPFMDGNGRTGRLILWWHQKNKSLPYTPIRYEDRINYYLWFSD